MTVQEIADMFETEEFWEEFSNDHVDRLYIEPPEHRDESDEDSGDESGGLLDNLSGRQLQAAAEVVLQSGQRIGNDDFDEDNSELASQGNDNFDEEDNVPLSTFVKKKPISINWLKDSDLPDMTTQQIFPQANFSNYRDKSAVEIFELFSNDDVIQLLIEESNRYALFINCPDPKITHEEMKCFLAILVVSGYDKKPSRKSYWDTGEDLRNTAVYNAMRRDRFIQIMRFLHCSDNNNLTPTDKMTKLRPLMNIIKKNFIEHYVPDQEIAYDESMIEYFGRHGCKQYIRGKPIRFGYKVWCINSKSGYLINFEVYQGSIPNSNPEHQKKFGKATAPLLQLIEDLLQEHKNKPFRFYFDNLFTSVKILYHLKEEGFEATGTIRENRVPKNCPLRSVKQMKKAKRGTYDYALTTDKKVVITRWMDNSTVTVVSTVHGVQPVSNANRYSASEKKKIAIPRPNCIGKYNKFMGGTDQMDSNINVYRISIRGKKWWWSIFTWLIDACIQNAWIIYRIQNPDTSQLNFRREIAQVYLKRYQNLPKSAGRPTCSGERRVYPEIRFDHQNHLVEYVPNNKRRRCAGNHTTPSAVRTQCRKCGVGLCITCFADYHNKR